MAAGSGSVEKVAKTFPKIIQAVKKLMFSFPILLSLSGFFFFFNRKRNLCGLWGGAGAGEKKKKVYLLDVGCISKRAQTGEKGGVELRFGG